jgi:hypothetical protein
MKVALTRMQSIEPKYVIKNLYSNGFSPMSIKNNGIPPIHWIKTLQKHKEIQVNVNGKDVALTYVFPHFLVKSDDDGLLHLNKNKKLL